MARVKQPRRVPASMLLCIIEDHRAVIQIDPVRTLAVHSVRCVASMSALLVGLNTIGFCVYCQESHK